MSGRVGESPSGTIIRDHTDPAIVDQFGNTWKITQSAQISVDGAVDRTTSGVTELAYINRVFWQWVSAKRLWWGKDSPLAPWLPPEGTPDSPIGPIPDPRIDQIITAIGSLAASNAAAFGSAADRQIALLAAIAAIPPPPPPDPRIAAIFGAVSRGFTNVHAMLGDIEAAAATASDAQADRWTALLERLTAIDAANLASTTAMTALRGQVDRIVTLLLDLFPNQPKFKIVLGTPTFTSQPAPTQPGP